MIHEWRNWNQQVSGLGSTRGSRVGFGGSPKRTFCKLMAIRAEILVAHPKSFSTRRNFQ